jgi:hypothetical protein
MSKVSYSSLKLKKDNTVSTFEFEGQEIEVLNYLGVEEKYDLIMVTLQKAEEDGIYNQLKVDMFFHLHLIYMYTNINFTEKQKEEESKLYNALKSSGFMDAFLKAIPQDEYNELYYYISHTIDDIMKYKNTAGAVLQSVINDLPKNAEKMKEIMESFDKEKYQQVMDFAEAAGYNK